jgi:hypothetical protein
LAGQRKYNTSFRKDISERSGLNPEILISRFTGNVVSFCQMTVTAVSSSTARGELQNTKVNFFSPGVENSYSELSRLSGLLGRLFRMTNRL